MPTDALTDAAIDLDHHGEAGRRSQGARPGPPGRGRLTMRPRRSNSFCTCGHKTSKNKHKLAALAKTRVLVLFHLCARVLLVLRARLRPTMICGSPTRVHVSDITRSDFAVFWTHFSEDIR